MRWRASSSGLPVARAHALAARRRGLGHRGRARLGRRGAGEGHGRARRALRGLLDQLVDREVEQALPALLVDDHLARGPEDLLHRLEVHALARDLRGALVFAEDQAEARRVALRGGDDTLAVAVGLLEE